MNNITAVIIHHNPITVMMLFRRKQANGAVLRAYSSSHQSERVNTDASLDPAATSTYSSKAL